MSLLSRYSALLFIVAALLCGIFGFSPVAQAEEVPLTGWGWSSNIGHVSFGSESLGAEGGQAYGVKLDTVTGDITGYAWSSSLGWLSFELDDVAPCPTLSGEDGGSKQARVENIEFDGTRQVLGWARFILGDENLSTIETSTGGWDGCVHLSSGTGGNHPTGIGQEDGEGGVTLIKEGTNDKFVGYAWGGEVVGWLDFAPFLEKRGGCSGSGCNPCVGTGCGTTTVDDCLSGFGICPGGGGSPLVDLKVNNSDGPIVPVFVLAGETSVSVTLSWETQDVSGDCNATGAWSGPKASGTPPAETVSNLIVGNSYTFRIDCPGNAFDEITVEVNPSITGGDPLDVTCSVSDISGNPIVDLDPSTSVLDIKINTPVRYTAIVTGGEPTYTYTWTGSGLPTTGIVNTPRLATTDTIQRQYGTTGLKNITAQVIDSGGENTAGECSLNPVVNVVPKDIEVVPD